MDGTKECCHGRLEANLSSCDIGGLISAPLFLQGSGHSGGIPADSCGMKISREAC